MLIDWVGIRRQYSKKTECQNYKGKVFHKGIYYLLIINAEIDKNPSQKKELNAPYLRSTINKFEHYLTMTKVFIFGIKKASLANP